MLLSKSPEVVEKLRKEHTRVFHYSFDETLNILQANPSKLDELDYTTAVIRETLRLFPVGFGVREAAEGYALQATHVTAREANTILVQK
jgi:cytochrome P450